MRLTFLLASAAALSIAVPAEPVILGGSVPGVSVPGVSVPGVFVPGASVPEAAVPEPAAPSPGREDIPDTWSWPVRTVITVPEFTITRVLPSSPPAFPAVTRSVISARGADLLFLHTRVLVPTSFYTVTRVNITTPEVTHTRTDYLA